MNRLILLLVILNFLPLSAAHHNRSNAVNLPDIILAGNSFGQRRSIVQPQNRRIGATHVQLPPITQVALVVLPPKRGKFIKKALGDALLNTSALSPLTGLNYSRMILCLIIK